MFDKGMPPRHEDADLEVLRPYISSTVREFKISGIECAESWLDPRGPRDATIRLSDTRALVWDEETGWRSGEFISGEQGVRTQLSDARYLGGGLLPAPRDVVRRFTEGVAEPCRKWRDHDEAADRFDHEVRTAATR